MRIVSLHCAEAGLHFGPVRIAERGWDRTRGLLGRPRITGNEGLLITRCRSVHTLGMGYAIDLVFLGDGGRIERVVDALAPMRLAMCLPARSVLELAAGRARQLSLRPGLQLSGW